VQDTNLICPPLISQYAAIGAMQTGSSYCKQQLQQLASVRAKVIQQLQSLNDYCQLTITDGAFYSLLKLNTELDDLSVVKRLIDEFKIALIPARAFGLQHGCYVRLSYGMLTQERVDIALQRLSLGIEQLCDSG
jgi:aspartate/methionine/tyrosine aminotransferase